MFTCSLPKDFASAKVFGSLWCKVSGKKMLAIVPIRAIAHKTMKGYRTSYAP